MTDSLRRRDHPGAWQAFRAGSRAHRRSFNMVRIERADPALVSGDVAGKVRGVAGMTAISAAFIDALPKLEIIANMGVGYDWVDARHAGTRGIMVTNTPDVLTEEVADTALGLLINAVRELPRAEQWLRQGRWEKDGNYPLTPATLRGRRAGIFGMGRIGHRHRRRLEAFGLPVAYHNRRAGRGRALRLPSDAGRPGACGRHADLGGAGRCRDREGGQRRGAGGARARMACSSISAAAARSTRRR